MNKKGKAEASDTTIKDLMMMVKEDIQKDLLRIETKLDSHIQLCEKKENDYTVILAKHDMILRHITDELPTKGYCAKVDMMYNELYPKEGLTLAKRVDMLIYDRAILKWTLGMALSAAFLSGFSLISRLFGKF